MWGRLMLVVFSARRQHKLLYSVLPSCWNTVNLNQAKIKYYYYYCYYYYFYCYNFLSAFLPSLLIMLLKDNLEMFYDLWKCLWFVEVFCDLWKCLWFVEVFVICGSVLWFVEVFWFVCFVICVSVLWFVEVFVPMEVFCAYGSVLSLWATVVRNLYQMKIINFAKPTVIEWPRETQRKRDICTFDYSVRVMDHIGSILTRPGGKPFAHLNPRKSCLRGRAVPGTRD